MVYVSLLISYIIASLPGEPTVAEKAQKFIESLGLGDRPNFDLRISVLTADPITEYNHTNIVNVTSIRRLRSKRAAGLPVVCPSSESEKSVCTNITGK